MLIEKTNKGYRAWHTVNGGKIYHDATTRIGVITKMLKEIFK